MLIRENKIIILSSIFAFFAFYFELTIQPNEQYSYYMRFLGSDFFSSGVLPMVIYSHWGFKKINNIEDLLFASVFLLTCYEFFQLGVKTMTFDVFDIIAYILGAIVYYILYTILIFISK